MDCYQHRGDQRAGLSVQTEDGDVAGDVGDGGGQSGMIAPLMDDLGSLL